MVLSHTEQLDKNNMFQSSKYSEWYSQTIAGASSSTAGYPKPIPVVVVIQSMVVLTLLYLCFFSGPQAHVPSTDLRAPENFLRNVPSVG